MMGIGLARRNSQPWFGFFPVEDKLRIGSSSDPLLIDVGGGLGHDLIAFQLKNPNLPGKLIVQDLPAVIDSIKDLPSGIEAMKYDFFKPQPVKRAKAYYMRTVLHDWPDKQALEILRHIRDAMTPESILLINETPMPESNVPIYSAGADWIMMAFFSALDRTQAQFKTLLEKAGFDLVGVWSPPDPSAGSPAVFEAVIKKA